MPRILTTLTPAQALAQIDRAKAELDRAFAARSGFKRIRGYDDPDLRQDHLDALDLLDLAWGEYSAAMENEV